MAIFQEVLMENISKLPEKIGNSEVKISENWSPRQSGNTFFFPPDLKWVYPLSEQQFLAAWSFRDKDHYYFFGIDEDPFISELSPRSIHSFIFGGAYEFYESLKPWVVTEFASAENIPIRQGDIWAIRVADDWGRLSEGMLKNRIISRKPQKRTTDSLYHTRHRLEGEIGQAVLAASDKQLNRLKAGMTVKNLKTEFVMLGNGILSAPNHKTVELPHGIYGFARTIGIRRSNLSYGIADD
jgi:hypothetical protein